MKARIIYPACFINKIIITGLLLLSITAFLPGQCYDHKVKPITFKKGDITVNAGIGLMPTFIGKDLRAPVPPISMIFNYRLKDHVTTGLYLGYSLTEATLTRNNILGNSKDEKKVKNNFYLVGLRMEGHCVRDRADFYGGAMFAYNFSDINSNLEAYHEYKNIKVENYTDSFTWSGHIGFKYLFSKHIGIFSEIGYGVSIFVIGITLKI